MFPKSSCLDNTMLFSCQTIPKKAGEKGAGQADRGKAAAAKKKKKGSSGSKAASVKKASGSEEEPQVCGGSFVDSLQGQQRNFLFIQI